MNSVLSDVYNIHCDGEFESAEIKISIEDIKENIDNLKIARFNFETNKFEILESSVSDDGKYIIAKTNHFYIMHWCMKQNYMIKWEFKFILF